MVFNTEKRGMVRFIDRKWRKFWKQKSVPAPHFMYTRMCDEGHEAVTSVRTTWEKEVHQQ